jgi:hypothetical protein
MFAKSTMNVSVDAQIAKGASMNPANTEYAQSVRLGKMADQNSNAKWDLTSYLTSLGMSQEKAEAWIKARVDARSFKTNESDEVGSIQDDVWKLNMRIDERRGDAGLRVSELNPQLQDIRELRQQHLRSRMSGFRKIAAILWFYSFAIWMYVIAFQIVQPKSVFWPLAVWLPRWVRLDYFGEAGFIASFGFALIWAKLSLQVKP